MKILNGTKPLIFRIIEGLNHSLLLVGYLVDPIDDGNEELFFVWFVMVLLEVFEEDCKYVEFVDLCDYFLAL